MKKPFSSRCVSLADRSPPKTVLIYSCEEIIGDGILKLRFAQEIKRRFPDTKLTWLAGTGKTVYASLFKSVAALYIDEVIEEAGIGNKTYQLATMWSPLDGRHFDLVVDTQKLVARTLICKRIKHKTFISGTANFLFSDIKPAKEATRSRAFVDSLIGMLDLVSSKPVAPSEPVFQLQPEWHALAAELLPAGNTYVGISPGAGDPRKLWPLDRFIAVARHQLSKGRVPVFLLGPEEKNLVQTIREQLPNALLPEWDRKDNAPHLKGPLLVMALAARMNAALANDSGVGHMLAVGGAPLVSLFTHHDPIKYRADARVIRTLHAQLDFGSLTANANDIPQEAVLDALEKMLAEEKPLRS